MKFLAVTQNYWGISDISHWHAIAQALVEGASENSIFIVYESDFDMSVDWQGNICYEKGKPKPEQYGKFKYNIEYLE